MDGNLAPLLKDNHYHDPERPEQKNQPIVLLKTDHFQRNFVVKRKTVALCINFMLLRPFARHVLHALRIFSITRPLNTKR